jgi:hypothetical protein
MKPPEIKLEQEWTVEIWLTPVEENSSFGIVCSLVLDLARHLLQTSE